MRLLGLALVLATLLGVTACGSGSSVVPSSVRQKVHAQDGSSAFLPTQLPSGYSFQTWQPGGAAGFDIYFSGPSGAQIGFHVVAASCKSMGTAVHTFETNGIAVKWSATMADQQAWRCLTAGGKQIVVIASRSVFGDDALRTSRQREDAQQLVDLVAKAQVAH